jgi:anthranilate 1,2-dioxygenase small subunit
MEKHNLDPRLVQEVEQLQVDYADCIDEERYQEWPSLFTEQCLYQIISRDNYLKKRPFGFLYCDNRRMLRDRITSMKSANIFEPHTYRHTLSRSKVWEEDDGKGGGGDGSLLAKTSYTVVRIMHDGAHELFSTGSYQDRIVREDGRLRFKERIVVTDSSRIDALLVIPL